MMYHIYMYIIQHMKLWSNHVIFGRVMTMQHPCHFPGSWFKGRTHRGESGARGSFIGIDLWTHYLYTRETHGFTYVC